MSERRVLGVATEAGSARALLPALAKLHLRGIDVYTWFRGAAERVLAANPQPGFNSAGGSDADSTLASVRPGLVVTGTTIGPGIEKDVTAAALARNIPVAAILDSWCNYGDRFDAGSNEWRTRFPDALLVMDEIAEAEAIEAGLPPERVRVTGHPAFDALVADRREAAARPAAPRRILFVSEPLRAFHARGIGGGFTELDAFSVLSQALALLPPAARPSVTIRPHPLESVGEWQQRVSESQVPAEVVASGPLLAAFSDVDAVVGISSIALVEAFLYGLPVAVIQAADHRADALVLTRMGILPRISSAEAMAKALETGFPPASAAGEEMLSWADGRAAERAAAALWALMSRQPESARAGTTA